MASPVKVKANGFNDDLWSGISNSEPSDLFPNGNQPNQAVAEDVEAKKATMVAFIPAAAIISKVLATERTKVFDLKTVLASLPPATERTPDQIKDELRARELYAALINGLDTTIKLALAQGGVGQNDG